jgi:methylated-DNA-[protein]-cysteine S-methyltransferase
MQIVSGDTQKIIEGGYFDTLGCSLIIERSRNKIRRVFFSDEQPSVNSLLAEGLIKHITQGDPCPNVEIDFSGFHEFRKKVSLAAMNIPRGRTMTYGELAALACHPKAARAVGQVMATNPFAIIVPCHRVVARRGLGGYFWGLEIKEKLLAAEANNIKNP